MNIPAELKYVDTHEWVRMEGDIAVVGITDFAQDQLGDVTFVELPAVGDMVEENKEMGSVESVKAASDLFSPVSGEVIEVNPMLENQPEILNSAPYTDGWMIKVKISAQPSILISADEYKNVISA
ncbi:glycine cleavage system protein GcvH [Desulfovibrio sp. OttesenSCG-928-C06]|nr:glycine cleavage system protein GcvH [Desulfovibrio sp. OttesenSCG-928-C06]